MKDHIENIIANFFKKKNTAEELNVLENWLQEDESNKTMFRQLNESYHLSKLSSVEKLVDTDRAWFNLVNRTGIKPRLVKLISKAKYAVWKVAASIAILISIGLAALLITNNSKSFVGEQQVEFITPGGEKSKIVLVDGTVVWLNSDSKLLYNINNPRKVKLEGEAFFDVVKDKKKSFIVETSSDFRIKVYGTRFNISAYSNEKIISATLEEGSVAVEGINTSKPVILNPGQQMVYDKETGKGTLSKVDPFLSSMWKENKLRFDNTTFGEVVNKIERWYDVEINLDPTLEQSQRFTMTVKTESLRELLQMISLTVDIKYEIDGEKVKISKK